MAIVTEEKKSFFYIACYLIQVAKNIYNEQGQDLKIWNIDRKG